jgi:hypothetical protein
MKTIFFLFMAISIAYGQSPETDHYANFHVEGNAAYWSKRYEIPTALVKDGIMSSGNLKNYQMGERGVYADLVDLIPKQGADLFGGKATIQQDSLGYTVTLRGINMKAGSNKVVAMSVMTGVQAGGTLQAFETVYVKNGKLKPSARKSFEILNDAFTRAFEFR